MTLVNDLARLGVNVSSLWDCFPHEAAIIEKALPLPSLCIRKPDTESPFVGILRDDPALRTAILRRKGLVQTISHHVAEYVQCAAVLRQRIVIVQAADLRVILVKNIQLISVLDISPGDGFPNFFPVMIPNGQCAAA